jgi:type IV pilus assembly protein PilP
MRRLRLHGWGLGLLLVWVAGCSDAPEADLQAWMAEQRAGLHPRAEPITPPSRFDPQPYTAADKTDPFSPQRLLGALKADVSSNVGNQDLVAPELARRKEPLEAYPLDAITMVGSLQKGGKPTALVKVDKLIYQVQPGAYLGQNYGKVIKITDTEVVLREIVQDAAGEWIERQATLQLQEGSR